MGESINMANRAVKEAFLGEIKRRWGGFTQLPNSNSLIELGNGKVRLYLRYSTLHEGRKTFNGLRRTDLTQLGGHDSFICFLWDEQPEPLLVPFGNFEAVFADLSPAADGQYKAQVILGEGDINLYLARAGRFNVEGCLGWKALELAMIGAKLEIPELSHGQVQSLLAGIGHKQGYDLWIPANNRSGLDRNFLGVATLRSDLPAGYEKVRTALEEVDVVWIKKGSNILEGLFEVEHTTSIYSGLLRFNDVHVEYPTLQSRFGIVANEGRRSLYTRQIDRPTFRNSRLNEVCTFYDYPNVFAWHRRVTQKKRGEGDLI